MALEIRKAERRKAKLRVGCSGPSGSGKTYSALLMARGLTDSWEKVLLIDTENGSGELYSNLGDYNVITLTAPFSPEVYIAAIHAAEEAGMEVVVIDSASHEWDGKGGCLEINEKLASAKYRGNTWAAWSETTPRHQAFLEAIVTSSCHVITTARSKVETMQTDDKKVKKVGVKEIQREGFEYELTVNFNLDRDGHNAIASKDRTGLFIDRDPFIITQQTGEDLLAWGNSGKELPVDSAKEKQRVMHNLTRLGFAVNIGSAEYKRKKIGEVVQALTGLNVTEDVNLPAIVRQLETFQPEAAQTLFEAYLKKGKEPAPKATEAISPEEYAAQDEASSEDIPF